MNESGCGDIACPFSIDNKNRVAQWLQSNRIALVSGQQAVNWLKADTVIGWRLLSRGY